MIPLPAYVNPDAWAGFCEMRRAMPKTRPFTVRAAVLILKELQRLKDAGYDPNAALDQSTLRGWADVYIPQAKEIAPAKHEESTLEYCARKATEHAMSKARVSAPPAHIRDYLSKVKP